MRRNDMNLWWGMWCIAVAIFFLGWLCSLTGCGAAELPPADTKETRFEITYSQILSGNTTEVVLDKETGREYLFFQSGYAGGLVLLPQPVEAETFTGEESKVFKSALPEEPIPEAYDAVTDEPKLKSIGTFTVSAYCPCTSCSDAWGDMTATGVRAVEGRTIAVDPKVIPYGTTVYFEGIDGFGGYVAEDCGGAINGNDIDIYFDTHEEAKAWGVKVLEVFVMEETA